MIHTNGNLHELKLDAKQLAFILGISYTTARSSLLSRRKLKLKEVKTLCHMFNKKPTFFGDIEVAVADLEYGDQIKFVWNDRIVSGAVTSIAKAPLPGNKLRPFEWHVTAGETKAVFGLSDKVQAIELVDTENPARTRNYTYGFLFRGLC